MIPVIRSVMSTSMDNKTEFKYLVPRPLFLQGSMSSPQGAVLSSGDIIMHSSPTRYPRPIANPYHQPMHQAPRDYPLSSEIFMWESDPVVVPPTLASQRSHVNTPPSAFSSLRQAVWEAELEASNVKATASAHKLPVNHSPHGTFPGVLHPPMHESRTMRHTSVIHSTPRETEYNDEEPEMSWNPPIQEAIFSSTTPLPIYSPLTIHSNRATPTHSYVYDQIQGQTPASSSSMNRHNSASPYAFVPIQEWNHEIDESLSYKENTESSSYKENTTRRTPSPVKLSFASKSWHPQDSSLSQYDAGTKDCDEFNFPSFDRNEAHKPLSQSNLKTPTKVSSFDYHKKGANYRHAGTSAPSPTFTVDTAEMTLDPPSVAESHTSIANRGNKASSLLLAMGALPVYTPTSEPQPYYVRGNVYANSDIGTNSAKQSSLAMALAAGEDQGCPVNATNIPYLSHQGRVQIDSSSQYSYCYTVNEHGQPQHIRPQSAPTFGRPSSVTLTKTDDDAQQRKCRVKTELCMHYENGRPCPFGSNCTYAHGEEELQMTKLIDLHEAGLVDMDTYRTKPCLTWVATGSCPFGKRCTGLHDYRVGSSSAQSWLPHTETQGNTIATDINVDGLHQKRLHTVLYDNPFGDQFTLTSMSPSGNNSTTGKGTWDDLNRLVCGGDISNDGGVRGGKNHRDGWIVGSNKRGGRQIHPIYKIQIALKLRGTDPDWQYKYRPQHVVHDELCMVLQKRAFCVTHNDHRHCNSKNDSSKPSLTASNATAISSVTEIPLSNYNARSPNHILVHEIAFGPDSDPSVRGVALWFNVANDEVTLCTPQQAKRFRWKKNGVNQPSSSAINDKKSSTTSTKPSVFDSGAIESFILIRPNDDMAFRLCSDMLKHRLSVLKRERISNMKERFETQQKLNKQEERLKNRFNSQRQSWLHWAWPVNCDRGGIDENTPVPPVEGPYLLRIKVCDKKEAVEAKKDPAVDEDIVDLGKNVHSIWSSFVVNISEEKENEYPITTSQKSKRLSVFECLSQGKQLSDNRLLPHILKDRAIPDQNDKSKGACVAVPSYSIQQERCWKSLLLHGDSSYGANEWEIVREHFENSRCKKVLSIIQQ